jgi:hypothetical protein
MGQMEICSTTAGGVGSDAEPEADSPHDRGSSCQYATPGLQRPGLHKAHYLTLGRSGWDPHRAGGAGLGRTGKPFPGSFVS